MRLKRRLGLVVYQGRRLHTKNFLKPKRIKSPIPLPLRPMADAPPSSAVPAQPQPQPQAQAQAQPDPTPVATPPPLQQQSPIPLAVQNPNPMQQPSAPIPAFPGAPPSFRPVPQFSPLPNYQAPPPGVAPAMQYQVQVPGQPPNPALRPSFSPLYAPPQGTVAPPGIARFPSPYPPMIRPLYPIRPPGVVPMVSRPPMPGIIGMRPITPPIIRPTIPSVTPAEKPQTTVYVGKIAPSVEDEFIHSLLLLCGPIKGWKRGQNPSGTPVGFGFCEFESAEGVLRALRLLSKLNIDGQELLLNVNEATKKYLERYVEKKTENSRNLKESQAAGAEKDDESAPTDDQNQSVNSPAEHLKNESDKKENNEHASFGIVTDEDREGDQDAVNKINCAIEERLKMRPLPPPPPPPLADGSGNQSWELQAKAKDGDAAEDDATDDKNDDDATSENKTTSEQDRHDTSSPDRSRRSDRSRDRERDLKREQEREVDRYEREAERERVRKERELRRKIEDAERAYEERLKDWEYREREKEKQRQYEKEKEKEKERKRRKEIQYDEDDEEDDRKRWRRSVLEERRRKRLLEKKEDLADRKREEEEIVEAQRRAEEEKQQLLRDASMLSIANIVNGGEETVVPKEGIVQSKDEVVEPVYQIESGYESQEGDAIIQNGLGDELAAQSVSESDHRQLGAAPAKKLGFGLVGSGKRAAVPSVFNEEDEDAHKDKKMRPLVPIDYSTDELQAIQSTASGATPSNLAAAAEYAKRISNVTPKEEKSDAERERSRRNHDRSSQRQRDHEDGGRSRDENREKVLNRDRDRGNGVDRVKTPDKQKLLDAKQLIDMIPKTKEELFSYEINWSVYDKHQLHERMRPWISKKITEFLGEEEATLVTYIVSSTQEHVQASQMLEMLQSILDDEAEMFVLKMWRMLIFEIKRVETGLAVRSKT